MLIGLSVDSGLAALAALEAFYGDPVRAVFDLRELLETFQGSYDASSLGMGCIILGDGWPNRSNGDVLPDRSP
jgi:hypothetical protein